MARAAFDSNWPDAARRSPHRTSKPTRRFDAVSKTHLDAIPPGRTGDRKLSRSDSRGAVADAAGKRRVGECRLEHVREQQHAGQQRAGRGSGPRRLDGRERSASRASRPTTDRADGPRHASAAHARRIANARQLCRFGFARQPVGTCQHKGRGRKRSIHTFHANAPTIASADTSGATTKAVSRNHGPGRRFVSASCGSQKRAVREPRRLLFRW